jgi:hypothetical protein
LIPSACVFSVCVANGSRTHCFCRRRQTERRDETQASVLELLRGSFQQEMAKGKTFKVGDVMWYDSDAEATRIQDAWVCCAIVRRHPTHAHGWVPHPHALLPLQVPVRVTSVGFGNAPGTLAPKMFPSFDIDGRWWLQDPHKIPHNCN